MTEINFKSTYRIPITQANMNSAKKKALKAMISGYENSIVGKGNSGFARVSVTKEEDSIFVQKLKQIGCKVFQIFEEHNISKYEIDEYIKEALKMREFKQIGKQMKGSAEKKAKKNIQKPSLIAETKESQPSIVNATQIVPKKTVSPRTKEGKLDKIRQTPDYIRIKSKYGEEFAEAVFFGIGVTHKI